MVVLAASIGNGWCIGDSSGIRPKSIRWRSFPSLLGNGVEVNRPYVLIAGLYVAVFDVALLFGNGTEVNRPYVRIAGLYVAREEIGGDFGWRFERTKFICLPSDFGGFGRSKVDVAESFGCDGNSTLEAFAWDGAVVFSFKASLWPSGFGLTPMYKKLLVERFCGLRFRPRAPIGMYERFWTTGRCTAMFGFNGFWIKNFSKSKFRLTTTFGNSEIPACSARSFNLRVTEKYIVQMKISTEKMSWHLLVK